jgi:hypothetical protein
MQLTMKKRTAGHSLTESAPATPPSDDDFVEIASSDDGWDDASSDARLSPATSHTELELGSVTSANIDTDSLYDIRDEFETEQPGEPDDFDDAECDHRGDVSWLRPDTRSRRRRSRPPQAAMAADFSEGRLETLVDTPQKELAGTKDAYVSYLVTTKVGMPQQSFDKVDGQLIRHNSPTSNHFSAPSFPFAVASQTLYSCGRHCRRSIRNVPSHRCQTSTRWSTCGATALGPTSPSGEHTRCTDSSSA